MTINEFRVALTVDDFERLTAFYRDGLGLEPGDLWTDGGQGQVFWAGRAALEIFDPQYAAGVDQIEAEKRISGPIRFAFEVPDIQQALQRALEYGAILIHEPVLTPWNDHSVRIQSPDGLQITLYEPQAQ